VLSGLELEGHGLSWRHAPVVLAQPFGPYDEAEAERAAVLHRSAEDTAAALDADASGDGETWLRLAAQWRRWRDPLLRALLGPFPPVRSALALLRRVGTADALHLARMLAMPADRLGAELFRGRAGAMLITGNAMHADIPAVATGSGAFGWFLAMLCQDVGLPVPAGGSGQFARALVSRARAAGAEILVRNPVNRVVVGNGRALGVLTEAGNAVRARRAVVADVPAPALYQRLLDEAVLPARVRADVRRFRWDPPTVKLNWALSGAVPWRATEVSKAGTVHLGASGADLAEWSADLASGRMSPQLFLLLGQMAVADPDRAPAGADSVWAYSHLPRDLASHRRSALARELAVRMEDCVEAHAPGFRDRILDRWVQLPEELESEDPSLDRGAVNGGTANLYQQGPFRPLPGLGRAETVVPGLFLAGASAHPGGGVHGAAGANAARAALAAARLGGSPGRAVSALQRWLAARPGPLPWPGD